MVDVADIGDALLVKLVARQDTREAGAEDGNVDFLVQRIAFRDGREGIMGVVVGEVVGRAHILLAAFATQALVALGAVLRLERGNVEFFGRWHVCFLAGHVLSHFSVRRFF